MKDPNGARAVFDDLFRFKIGDWVVDAALVRSWTLDLAINPPHASYERVNVNAHKMIILGRRLEECHGGIQAQYLIRRFTERGDIHAVINEFELAPVAEWEALALAFAEGRKKESPFQPRTRIPSPSDLVDDEGATK